MIMPGIMSEGVGGGRVSRCHPTASHGTVRHDTVSYGTVSHAPALPSHAGW